MLASGSPSFKNARKGGTWRLEFAALRSLTAFFSTRKMYSAVTVVASDTRQDTLSKRRSRCLLVILKVQQGFSGSPWRGDIWIWHHHVRWWGGGFTAVAYLAVEMHSFAVFGTICNPLYAKSKSWHSAASQVCARAIWPAKKVQIGGWGDNLD